MRLNKLFIFSRVFIFTLISFTAANATDFTVTKSTNSNDGVCDADCSIREAVAVAQSGDTVIFNSNLIGQTFTLGGSEIVITNRITIDGDIDGVNVAFISGAGTSRIFFIAPGGGLDLKNAILVQGNGNGAQSPGSGGAIFVRDGSLFLDRVAIRGNAATRGGAIMLSTAANNIITNSSITTNTADDDAPGILMFSPSNLYISNTTISNNRVIAPDAFAGGALVNLGGELHLRNCTITNNQAGRGGGIYAGGSLVSLGNTIVANNTVTSSGPDIFSTASELESVGGNLIGNTQTIDPTVFTQTNDALNINPLLAPVNANQGGHPVSTHPLQAGSPALNTGINALAVEPLGNAPLATDGRGIDFPRIAGATVDKGAFEDQSLGSTLIVTKLTNSNDNVCDNDCSLREAVFAASQDPGTDNITMAANVFGTMIVGTEIAIENHNVNIIGYPSISSNTLIVSGNNASRVFRLENANVSMTGFTVANGNGLGQSQPFGGGGLFAFGGSLTLNQMIFRNNQVSTSDFIRGGAIAATGVNVVRIMNSTFNNNLAPQTSGIELGNAVAYLTNTTVSTNTAVFEQGLGAVSANGSLYMRNSTIANNRASSSTSGAGLYCGSAAICNLGNNILADNLATTGSDLFVQPGGTIQSVGGNLVEDQTGYSNALFNQANDQLGLDPALQPLTDNGGNVTTQMPGPSGAAVNSGLNSVATDPFSATPLTTDARGGGFSRIVGIVDKGAFETLIPSAAGVTISGRIRVGKAGLKNALVVITDQQGHSRTMTTGTFGLFKFEEVEAGQTYIITVKSKRYSFETQFVQVTDNIADLMFDAVE
ncbi:MAG TPA: choice-of-anchor Q domain-containing protein [Pyrinomonadaceae bacterium]|nr:choice-of-anchor Q domain-containing protein [Pyrinomonadaceae bacterium]